MAVNQSATQTRKPTPLEYLLVKSFGKKNLEAAIIKIGQTLNFDEPIKAGVQPTVSQKIGRETQYLLGNFASQGRTTDLSTGDIQYKKLSPVERKEAVDSAIEQIDRYARSSKSLPVSGSLYYDGVVKTLAAASVYSPVKYKNFIKDNEGILTVETLIDAKNMTPALAREKTKIGVGASKSREMLPQVIKNLLDVSQGKKRFVRKDLQELEELDR